MSQRLSRIDAIVETAVRGLFGSLGLTLGPLESPDAVPHGHDVAASIGFTAPLVQGAILMTTRKSIVADTWPVELRPRTPSERQACDWAGELVNQLLGRVKNALVAYGVTLEQSTPTVVTGQHVHRSPPSTNVARHYVFRASDGSIFIYFDAAMSDDLTLETPRTEPRAASEGDVHLF